MLSGSSHCRSYSRARLRSPLRKAGWAVGSLTRSPAYQISGGCSRCFCSRSSPRLAPIGPSLAELGDAMLPQRHVHRAPLGVEIETVLAALPADPAHLAAAEGGAQITHVVGVDPDQAGFDALAHNVRD